MKLYGSTTSPYVRRIRLYLASQGVSESAYDFVNLDIFSSAGREQLKKDNPTLKVPYLVDQQIKLFDSRIIHRYLAKKYNNTSLTWSQENTLTLIDAANDSLVSLLLSQRSGFDTQQDVLFFNLQNERLATIFTTLDQYTKQGVFTQWHYLSICFFCLLDWIEFRQLYDLSAYTSFTAFMAQAKQQAMIVATDPR